MASPAFRYFSTDGAILPSAVECSWENMFVQPGNGHLSAWFEMNLPAAGVMMSFWAKGSRVRMVKFMLWTGGLLDPLVRVMLVRLKRLLG